MSLRTGKSITISIFGLLNASKCVASVLHTGCSFPIPNTYGFKQIMASFRYVAR